MMKTRTFADVALLVGPFLETESVEVPARGDEGKKFLKEKFGDAMISFVYFDILETTFQGLRFTSEPHNQQLVEFITRAEVVKLIDAARAELSEALGSVLSKPSGEKKTSTRTLH